MSRVREIEEQVRTLSGAELRELRSWIDEFEAQLWDKQIAADAKAGRLNHLLEQALREEAGAEELGFLAQQLADAKDPAEAVRLREALTRGFYGC